MLLITLIWIIRLSIIRFMVLLSWLLQHSGIIMVVRIINIMYWLLWLIRVVRKKQSSVKKFLSKLMLWSLIRDFCLILSWMMMLLRLQLSRLVLTTKLSLRTLIKILMARVLSIQWRLLFLLMITHMVISNLNKYSMWRKNVFLMFIILFITMKHISLLQMAKLMMTVS